jgi:type III pantothenate kinase
MTSRIAINIGNTRIACGFFVDDELKDVRYFLHADADSACEQLSLLAPRFTAQRVALGSVVPDLSATIQIGLKQAGFSIYNITAENQTLLHGVYKTLGADRLANAAAAYRLYSRNAPAMVLDFGTATTLTAVNQDGKFLGGLITLGLGKTFETLHSSTAQLPNMQHAFVKRNPKSLAQDTQDAIAGGCLLGHVGLVEHWIKTAKETLGEESTVIATGGYSKHIRPLTKSIEHYDPQLTIRGINLIADHSDAHRMR